MSVTMPQLIRASVLLAGFIASAVVSGCASGEPSRPMEPRGSASGLRPASETLHVPSADSAATRPAPRAGASTAPSSIASASSTRADAPSGTRSPSAPSGGASAARPSTGVTAPASIPTVRASTGPISAGASTAAASAFGEFSTSLIYPDTAGANLNSPEGLAGTTITLAEFQNGRWAPIMSAPAQDFGGTRAVTFRNIPAGRMVLPMYASGAAAANPWAIARDGTARELKGPCATCPSDEPSVLTLEIIPTVMGGASERAAHDPASSNIGAGVIAVRAAPGRRYTLLYWDRAWVPVGEVTVGNETTRINGVPSKRVLWLRDESGSSNLTLPAPR